MKKIILLVILVFFSSIVHSQNEKRIVLNLRNNTTFTEMLSSSSLLFYEYQNAIVFTSAGTGKALMNYNMLTDEMLFVSYEGDTLAWANPKDVRYIRFGKTEFIYTSKGYMEVLSETRENQTLLVHRKIKLADIKSYGPYGTTKLGGVENVDILTNTGLNMDPKLTVNKEATFKVDITYYLQRDKSLLPATEANFQKVFGKEQKDRIRNYIKEAKLNLKKEEDIIQLFNFCADNKNQ